MKKAECKQYTFKVHYTTRKGHLQNMKHMMSKLSLEQL